MNDSNSETLDPLDVRTDNCQEEKNAESCDSLRDEGVDDEVDEANSSDENKSEIGEGTEEEERDDEVDDEAISSDEQNSESGEGTEEKEGDDEVDDEAISSDHDELDNCQDEEYLPAGGTDDDTDEDDCVPEGDDGEGHTRATLMKEYSRLGLSPQTILMLLERVSFQKNFFLMIGGY